MNKLDFNHKNVLVTGGSDGIGYGVAQCFKEAGATVSITGTRPKEAYEKSFDGFNFYQLQVTDAQQVIDLLAQFTHLDVLVNCIGIARWQKAEFEREVFASVIDTNLTGIMHLCTESLPLLQASGGNIINLDSVVTERPAAAAPAYTASKAALAQLTKALAQKWGKQGVRVNSIAPGLTATKLTANQTGPDTEAYFEKSNPIGRLCTPEDIGNAALFLASPMAGYITGHRLLVDGGLSI
jgi:3-oxoacyl-[acyl-carrier protein] reductase